MPSVAGFVRNLCAHRPNRLLSAAIILHIFVCAAALVYEAAAYPNYHIFYGSDRLGEILAGTAAFASFGLIFLLRDFSFGYLISYHFYAMVGGFLWINCFTDLRYDYKIAGFSAVASGLAFVVPAMFVNIDIARPRLSSKLLSSALLYGMLLVAMATIAWAACYNLNFTTIQHANEVRMQGGVYLPSGVRYAVGVTSSSLLPFAFAGFFLRKQYVQAGFVILLLACFYPITLSKTAFFSPVWLLFVAALSSYFEARLVSVLILLIPMSIGLASTLFPVDPYLFWLLDHRLFVVPANALAIYNDFFAHHQPTYFCQINAVRAIFGCQYGELGPEFRDIYQQGNYNASLFATEGIASVGATLAPLPVLFCALMIALANAASRHLTKRFVLISGSVLPQLFLNVPFSVVMVSMGAGCLFLLWYVSPDHTCEPVRKSV